MDRQVGEVLASLEKHGYLDRTLFAFTADQGAQWPFAKWDVYDAGMRTPLLVRWPGKVKPGSRTSAMVSLVDLLPTLIEAAGGAAPKEGLAAGEIDGRSFLPVLLGQQDHHRDRVFATHTGDGQMNRSPSRCVRTARYKYVLNLAPQTRFKTHISEAAPEDGRSYWDSWLRKAKDDPRAAEVVRRFHNRPAEELYDLEADAYEQRNLAADPALAETLAGLRESLKQWRLRQGEDLAKVPMPEDARRGEIFYAK
jgi:arylsulfatase A-like enzyme